MKTKSAALLLTLPALLALAPLAEKLAYHPAAGSTVTRTFTSKTQMALDDMAIEMNGQPLPQEIQMDMEMGQTQTIVVNDEFVAVDGPRPTKLRRSFEKLSQTGTFSMQSEMMPGGGQDRSVEGASDLEGKTVLFTWDPEGEVYTPTFDRSEGDAELLEGLEEDMDLRALLPPADKFPDGVSDGDTWTIDAKQLKPLLMPGGNLKIEPQDAEVEASMPGMDNMGDFADMLGDLLEGQATATYRGTREVEGRKVGVVHLALDISSATDMSERVAEAMQNLPEGSPEMTLDHMDVELEMEGEGNLYWDLERGIAQSFDMSGTMRVGMDMGFDMAMGEQSMSMTQNMQMSGTFNNAMTTAR